MSTEKKYPRKIKVYVDEDIPSCVVKFARENLRWDARYVCEKEKLREKKDTYHHRKAREEKRLLLTRDKDYLDPVRFPYYKSSGVIIIEERNAENMIGILPLLSALLQKMLKQNPRYFSFTKMIISTRGIRLRYQETEGRIEEKLYSWEDKLP